MKKRKIGVLTFISIVLLLLSLLIIKSCEKEYYQYTYDDLMNNYVKFEMVNASCGSPKCYNNSYKIIPEELIDKFCLDLSNIKFEIVRVGPLSPQGIGFKLSTEKYYDIIPLGMMSRYDLDSQFIESRHIGYPQKLKDLIEKWSHLAIYV